MTDRDILILGGFGYVGSYLSQYFGNRAIRFGNRLCDYNTITVDQLQRYHYIILLAGHSSVQSCQGPLMAPWLNNVVNFKWLVENTCSEQKIIYASSSSVYGNKNSTISTEDDISLDYINNYDLTKITLDLYALKQINSGREIIGLRFGTVNGGSPVIRRDLMINSMVFNALQNKEIIVSNKHIRRPILFIHDLARAIDCITSCSTFYPGIYNLASFNTTVQTISKEVSNRTGAKIVDEGNKDGVYDFEISSRKFEETYNFKFEGTTETVVDSVLLCYTTQDPNIVVRNEYFEYPVNYDLSKL